MEYSIKQYFSKIKNVFKKDIKIILSMNYWRESNPIEEYNIVVRSTFSELEKEASALKKAPSLHLNERKFPIIAINIEEINGKKINYKDVPLDVDYIDDVFKKYFGFFRKARLDNLLNLR